MLASSRSMRTDTIPAICSPCFLVATPGSTAMHVGFDYGEVNKKTQNHSGSIPNMENTLERIAKCQSKTKEDTHSGFWQVDLTPAAQELLAFATHKGRVFRWNVMPFGVANGPALFQELMNEILYILIPRPLVQILVTRGAEMDADIENVSLRIKTQEDHISSYKRFSLSVRKTICAANSRNLSSCGRRWSFQVSTLGMAGGRQLHRGCKPARHADT